MRRTEFREPCLKVDEEFECEICTVLLDRSTDGFKIEAKVRIAIRRLLWSLDGDKGDMDAGRVRVDGITTSRLRQVWVEMNNYGWVFEV